MDMMMDFSDAVTPDAIPEVVDVTNPCRKCGNEIDVPYGGRGPKPKHCSNCKGSNTTTRKQSPRITGNAQTLAAQATSVLVQVNALVAMAAGAMGLFKTGGAIVQANETFEQAAYQALLTDPEFCKSILKSGAKSAKVSLGLAYGGMAMTAVPVAVMEIKEKKAAREAELANETEDRS